MQISLFKVIRVEQQFFGPFNFAAFFARLETKWKENPQYHMRHRTAEIILRWPRAVKIRLDFAQYRTGGFLEPHIDTTQEHEAQINFIFLVRKPEKGGELLSERFVYKGNRLRIIRPDLYEHEVTLIEKGERWVLNLQIRFSTDGLQPPPF